MEKQNVPKVRFPGFTDPWEQRKLSDLVDVCSGRDYKHLSEGTIPVYGTGGYMLSVNEALSYDRDAVGIGRKGTIDNPYILKAPFWTVDTLFYAIPKQEDCLNFIYDVFQTIDWKKKDESTGVPSLSKVAINDTSIRVPSVEEQRVIGKFFKSIDNTITLHQRKCDEFKELKEGMLQKMFPKEGKTVPEIRFPGFTDDWGQRKLGDQMYIKSRIGWQALTRDEYLSNGDYYLITGTDIDESTHTVDLSRSYYVSKERYEMDDKIQVREGDIIVTKDGTIGKVAMIKGLDKPATINSHLFVLRDLSGRLDNHFLLQLLSSQVFTAFVESTKTGSTLTGLPQKTFVEFKFLVPTIEEQKQIAAFLDTLDKAITLHQRKCDELKVMKKAMIQQMFV